MTKNKKALIIFARKPELGKVKTRLAATIGDKKALEIYKKLLAHTKDIVRPLDCDKFVFLTQQTEDNFWNNFYKELQDGINLGDKMANAFDTIFSKGYNDVIIIGTDCPKISTEIVSSAFEKLRKTDVVIGPAEDGGYYLLGIKKIDRELFENKEWSSENVLNESLHSIEELNLSYALLPKLNDVDHERDVPNHWL